MSPLDRQGQRLWPATDEPHSTAQHSTAQRSTAQRSTTQHSTARRIRAHRMTINRNVAQSMSLPRINYLQRDHNYE